MARAGSSAAWLARHVRDVEVGGSNPPFPTKEISASSSQGRRPMFGMERFPEPSSSCQEDAAYDRAHQSRGKDRCTRSVRISLVVEEKAGDEGTNRFRNRERGHY